MVGVTPTVATDTTDATGATEAAAAAAPVTSASTPEGHTVRATTLTTRLKRKVDLLNKHRDVYSTEEIQDMEFEIEELRSGSVDTSMYDYVR